jgi:hypothetical protein
LKVQILMPPGLTAEDDIEPGASRRRRRRLAAPVRPIGEPATNKDHTKVCLYKTNKSPLSPLVGWSKCAKDLDSSRYNLQSSEILRTERWVQAKEDLVMLHNRDELDGLLKQAFAEGVRWPIERPSLNALSELGLSVEQIARYFSVDPVEVRAFLWGNKRSRW